MDKKNFKSKRVFIKIFLPVAIILIFFAIISFAYNYISIDSFVKDNARGKLLQAIDDIKLQIKNFDSSKDETFKLKSSDSLISEGNSTKVYVYDENFKEIGIFDNTIYIDTEMNTLLSELLNNFELEEDVITTIDLKGREYLVDTYVVNPSVGIKERYFVVAEDLTIKARLIRESLKNIIIIQIIILILAVMTVYKIASDISKPITNLSNESGNYVVGKGVTISSKPISISEVESLRKVLYNMQLKIDEEDLRKNTIYENVAHDLRTPLVSILGYASGLKSGIIKDTDLACDVIVKTGNQLKEMIENILILSRFDNDTYKVLKEKFSINDLVREQIEIIKVLDSDKNIILNENANLEVYTDRKLVIRIIQNLLSNAIKYANSKIEIDISDNVMKIIDDGDGIVKEDLENIFERYYKGKSGHFGIGLAVVKNAVSYIGWEIEVESEIGVGTVFTIKM